MDKDKKEWETRATGFYAPPGIEVHKAVPCRLIATSFIGEAGGGTNQDNDLSEHERGIDGGVEYGAKTVILGQEFSFNDVWDD